ncbi:MAG: hypothetical protein GX455_14880 [Phycisphaerae bacterium]|nr:hypothetical protein [Phycisphaerae bacterium]
MSIRVRIEDAFILFSIERLEAALLSILVAVAATARRRYPQGTPSLLFPGKDMGDREAFERFVKDEMPRICRIKNFNVNFRGEMHAVEHIFYKWIRCELAHEAALPQDVVFIPDPDPDHQRLQIRDDGVLVLSHGWMFGLIDVVIHAPENADQFGIPPKAPLPIYLPKIDMTVDTGGKSERTAP